SGGVSQVDSFDPKPTLQEYNGKPMPMKVERTQFNNNGNVFPSPFQFANYGQSGIPVSSIFPHTAKMVDDMAVIRSMTSKVNEHAQGNYAIHTGFPFMGHPTAGAWVSYGLGSLNQNLPSFVVLHSGGSVPPHGGVGLYGSGYLPANNQGSILQVDMDEPIRNVKPHEPLSAQRKRLDFHKSLDRHFLSQTGNHPQVEAAIRNHEVAYKMQAAVPELCDLKGESEATKKLYGLDSSDTQKAAYARQCLLARRLVERGVRFVELSCLTEKIGAGGAANPWDQHGALEKGHAAMAHQVDQPIAGLLQDLKVRGLLDETLVIWAGEFGRTPFSQGSTGRDHNPYGFSIWMAGGGIKGGTVYGSTDDFGYHVTENKCDFYDLWATVLHLLGLDHENLTYRHGGRDLRLTDVHGRLLHPILA
ncbi:MAG: DUF1501 domain-containing protein, partial [Verrucomicrobiota bacterium]|nr:DUF1501 domain-containing protein [Verrucomicrobiota bacterium]